jgi:hypothetical protein
MDFLKTLRKEYFSKNLQKRTAFQMAEEENVVRMTPQKTHFSGHRQSKQAYLKMEEKGLSDDPRIERPFKRLIERSGLSKDYRGRLKDLQNIDERRFE